MHTLITGGAGFIGSNYVHRLLKRGDCVGPSRGCLANRADRVVTLEGFGLREGPFIPENGHDLVVQSCRALDGWPGGIGHV